MADVTVLTDERGFPLAVVTGSDGGQARASQIQRRLMDHGVISITRTYVELNPSNAFIDGMVHATKAEVRA